VEIVDTEDGIKSFLPNVEKLIEEGRCGEMITMEDVEIVRYSASKRRSYLRVKDCH
jgi:PII-like signaling protein